MKDYCRFSCKHWVYIWPTVSDAFILSLMLFFSTQLMKSAVKPQKTLQGCRFLFLILMLSYSSPPPTSCLISLIRSQWGELCASEPLYLCFLIFENILAVKDKQHSYYLITRMKERTDPDQFSLLNAANCDPFGVQSSWPALLSAWLMPGGSILFSSH